MNQEEENLLNEFLKSSSKEELALREAITNENPALLFEKKCKEELDISGMRLDLFYE